MQDIQVGTSVYIGYAEEIVDHPQHGTYTAHTIRSFNTDLAGAVESPQYSDKPQNGANNASHGTSNANKQDNFGLRLAIHRMVNGMLAAGGAPSDVSAQLPELFGLEEDIKLAEKVPEINLICGGHSHDFMIKEEEIIVSHANGKKTLIIHSGARGEYLGKLDMLVDKGKIISHSWAPVRITTELKQDKKALALIMAYKNQLPGKKVLTVLEKALDCRGGTLRAKETAAGNLITDIIREHFKTDIAFQNGGGIRGERIIPPGNLTTNDIDLMLPFKNKITILSLKGYKIKQALEQSVSFLPLQYGGFLQVSGISFDIDVNEEPFKMEPHTKTGSIKIIRTGNRVSKIMILDINGNYIPLNPYKTYQAAVNSFLANGGDNYFILKNRKKCRHILPREVLSKTALAQCLRFRPKQRTG